MTIAPAVAPALCLLAFAAALGTWFRHCYQAMETSHPWLDPMPFWRRLAYDPTLVLFATSPVLYFLVMWQVFGIAQAFGIVAP